MFETLSRSPLDCASTSPSLFDLVPAVCLCFFGDLLPAVTICASRSCECGLSKLLTFTVHLFDACGQLFAFFFISPPLPRDLLLPRDLRAVGVPLQRGLPLSASLLSKHVSSR